MASIIKIKRSGSTGGAPGTLANGELAYSYLAGDQSNGGDRIFIGVGAETAGNAAERHVIGGKYFTDMLDHVKGTLTASSALVVDADSKLDEFKVDNLDLNGATIASYNYDLVTPLTDININFDPLGDGTLRVIPPIAGLYKDLVVDANDIPNKDYVDSQIGAVNSLVVEDEALANNETVALGTDSLQIEGGEGIDTVVVRDPTPGESRIIVTISGELATAAVDLASSNLGISSYNSTNFTVTGGFVESNDITIGTTALTLGEETLVLAGLEQLDVDNVRIDGNTVSSTNIDGDLILDANGAGNIDVNNNKITNLADPENNLDAVNYQTLLTAVGDISTLVVQDDNNTDIEVLLTEDILKFVGGEGMNVTASVAVGGIGGATPETITFTIEGEDATADTTALAANKGIASFDSVNFTVTGGFVESNDITIGTTALTLGEETLVLAGLQQVTIDELDINGSTISAVGAAADLNVNLSPKGNGVVDVSNDGAGESRITNVADPLNPADAANKRYVDEVAQGLTVRPAARAGTTSNLSATYDNGTDGVGATLTATANGALGLIDGVGDTTPGPDVYGITQTDRVWATGDLILVRSQTNKFENGLYEVTAVGDAGNPWVLTRQRFVDDATEIPSSYVFIQEGNTLAGTGWAAIVEDFNAFDVGIDDITWYQFSGAGSVTAGDGIDVVGTLVSVDISATGSGLTFAAGSTGNALVVNPLIAGDGLTYDATGTGIINVVGTADRITVGADSVDIAATYVGQGSITTLGSTASGTPVTTGTWNADTVTVPYGGTGATTFTAKGVIYGNGTDPLQVTAVGVYDVATGTGELLSVDSNGVPTWTSTIDGGEY